MNIQIGHPLPTKIEINQRLAELNRQHLRLIRSRHVAWVLSNANAPADEKPLDLLLRQDAVYAEYRDRLRDVEAAFTATSKIPTE